MTSSKLPSADSIGVIPNLEAAAIVSFANVPTPVSRVNLAVSTTVSFTFSGRLRFFLYCSLIFPSILARSLSAFSFFAAVAGSSLSLFAGFLEKSPVSSFFSRSAMTLSRCALYAASFAASLSFGTLRLSTNDLYCFLRSSCNARSALSSGVSGSGAPASLAATSRSFILRASSALILLNDVTAAFTLCSVFAVLPASVASYSACSLSTVALSAFASASYLTPAFFAACSPVSICFLSSAILLVSLALTAFNAAAWCSSGVTECLNPAARIAWSTLARSSFTFSLTV